MQDTVDPAPSPPRGRPTVAGAGLKIGHGRVAVHGHRCRELVAGEADAAGRPRRSRGAVATAGPARVQRARSSKPRTPASSIDDTRKVHIRAVVSDLPGHQARLYPPWRQGPLRKGHFVLGHASKGRPAQEAGLRTASSLPRCRCWPGPSKNPENCPVRSAGHALLPPPLGAAVTAAGSCATGSGWAAGSPAGLAVSCRCWLLCRA